MGSNFQFLKKVNSNLFDIISEAEKLYRDEYFDQCMVQTRRFGEQICKNMLEQNNKQTGTFDEMLATLQDNVNGHTQEKEFIDDLYFLKKNGNQSAHSSKVKKDGVNALECLKRAFEIAINYSVYAQGAPSNILKLNYDVELLITNKKSKPSLTEKYEQEKKKQEKTKTAVKKEKTATKTVQKIKEKKEKKEQVAVKIPLFWKLIIFLSCVSFTLIIFLITITQSPKA